MESVYPDIHLCNVGTRRGVAQHFEFPEEFFIYTTEKKTKRLSTGPRHSCGPLKFGMRCKTLKWFGCGTEQLFTAVPCPDSNSQPTVTGPGARGPRGGRRGGLGDEEPVNIRQIKKGDREEG